MIYSHILIATDGSEFANNGLDHGLALAKALGSKVTIVTVTEPWHTLELAREIQAHPGRNPLDDFEKAAAAVAEKILNAAAAAATTTGVTAETAHIQGAHPAPGIISAAKDRGCSLIVMASHGRRGLQRLMLGSQAAEVVAHSEIPVLIIR
jgi:nucleotide-binding universal stress UspA family protein